MSGMNSVNDRLQDAVEDDKYDGYIIGTVTENNDPDGVARIKIKIPNVLDTDQGPVPWCLPSKHSPFGQGAGYGVYGSPKIGSPVRVRFQNGDPNYPVYEADEYLKAHANVKFKDPNTWGYKDPGGSELWVDYATGAWEWTHQSGTFFKYDGQGNMSMHVAKDQTNEIVGHVDTTVQGDVVIEYQKTLNFTVVGNTTIDIQGSLSASVGAGATIDVQGSTSLTSSGAVNITGSVINLN